MIRPDMPVIEFTMTLWKNKIKVVLSILAIVFGQGLHDEWQVQRATEKFEADRQGIDAEASIAGMMLANAWTSCKQIGIVNDMERCASHNGRLLQEIAAPQSAKIAIEQRDSYSRNCQRFYTAEYCSALLGRSLQVSFAQQKTAHSD